MKRPLVLCHGVFDVLHMGHITHFLQARKLAPFIRVWVSVTADEFVGKPGRPINTLENRMGLLKQLRMVTRVIPSYASTPDAVILDVRPDFYCKGEEYRGRLPEQSLVESLGGNVFFTTGYTDSSTRAIKMLHG